MQVRLPKQPQCQLLRAKLPIGAAAELGSNLDPSQEIREPVAIDPVEPAVAGEHQSVAEAAGKLEFVPSVLAMGEREGGSSCCLAQLLLKVLPGMPQLGLGIVDRRQRLMADTVGSDGHTRMRKVSETRIVQYFRRITRADRRQAVQDLLSFRGREFGDGGDDWTDGRQGITLRDGLIGQEPLPELSRHRCRDSSRFKGSENALLPETLALPDRSCDDKKGRRQPTSSQLGQGAVSIVGPAVVECYQKRPSRQGARAFPRRQHVSKGHHPIVLFKEIEALGKERL